MQNQQTPSVAPIHHSPAALVQTPIRIELPHQKLPQAAPAYDRCIERQLEDPERWDGMG